LLQQIGEKKSMEYKDQLTNEKIRKKFVSQFELVNYAIKLAENMIQSGRDPRVKIESQNRSLQVLSEILNDKDRFDEIIYAEEEAPRQEYKRNDESNFKEKNSDRKRSRKVLAE
jgi:DNA-directed RNA polymerase subunit omega